jgi:uncharacterized membrane protein
MDVSNAVNAAAVPSPDCLRERAEDAEAIARRHTRAHFRAVLLPHRQELRKGFITLAVIIGGVSLLMAALLFPFGTWPLTILLVLQALLTGAAFRTSIRAGRMFETVELTGSELRLTRIHPSGDAQSWTFNPCWVRFEFEDRGSGANCLRFRSRGRVLSFGHFLSNEERRGFATALGAALHDARGTRI